MFTHLKKFGFSLTKRLVYQQENSPKSPEDFKNPEKQSDKDIISEVASQSPSQIVSDTLSRGGAVQKKYTQSTQILANLMGGSTSSSSTTTAANSNTSSAQTSSNNANKNK